MGKRVYWVAQITGWSSYMALIILATYADDPSKVDFPILMNILSLIVFSIGGTHLMRMVFLRLGWLDMKLGPLVPRILASSLVCSVFIAVSTKIIAYAIEPNELDKTTFLGILINILAMLVLVLFWNAIYFTVHFFQKSRKQELNNISLEASRNEVELKNLRSQLNPHFLFNSLNSIRALIEIEPEKAKEAVTTLSNLLRSSLLLGKENLVRLGDELEMVSNYLDLEKIRFEERLNIKWKTDPSLNDFMVPPFILQMLTENAIKHGISNLINGGDIMIETSKEDGKVIIRVVNSGQLTGKVDTGIGIQNTKRRLDLQFKGMVDFELKQVSSQVIAQLKFNQ
jgi:LytS/YehU family sensor histidine kinase